MPFTGRQVALNYIPQLIEEGLNNSAIVSFLKEQGFGYRNQNMFADVNRMRLENFGASFIPKLTPESQVPDRFMREWEGDTEYTYRVVVKYEYEPGEGGEAKVGGTTFYFDNPPTQAEVSELFELRRDTLGDSTPDVGEVFGVTSAYYYKNVKQRGD